MKRRSFIKRTIVNECQTCPYRGGFITCGLRGKKGYYKTYCYRESKRKLINSASEYKTIDTTRFPHWCPLDEYGRDLDND